MPRKKESNEEKNPFVAIATSITALSIPIVAIFLAMARDQAVFLVPIIGFLAIMGILLGYFEAKRK